MHWMCVIAFMVMFWVFDSKLGLNGLIFCNKATGPAGLELWDHRMFL